MGYNHDRIGYSGQHGAGHCDPCSDPVLPAPYPTVHYPLTNPCPPQRVPQHVPHQEAGCHTSQQHTHVPRAGHIPWNTLFDEHSTATASNVVLAHAHGQLFQAFGLAAGDIIRLQMVSGTYQNEVVQDVIIGGLPAQLTADNNILFVPFPGRFRLQYTGGNLGAFHAYSMPVPFEHYPAMAAFTQAVATAVNIFETSPSPATEPATQVGPTLPTRMTGTARHLILGDPDGWFEIGGKRIPYWN